MESKPAKAALQRVIEFLLKAVECLVNANVTSDPEPVFACKYFDFAAFE